MPTTQDLQRSGRSGYGLAWIRVEIRLDFIDFFFQILFFNTFFKFFFYYRSRSTNRNRESAKTESDSNLNFLNHAWHYWPYYIDQTQKKIVPPPSRLEVLGPFGLGLGLPQRIPTIHPSKQRCITSPHNNQ